MHCSRAGTLLALLLSGCATTGTRDWGSQVTWHPSASTLGSAALDAAKSPRVWIPLAGAALFQIDNWDHKTSDHLREHTPVFGSESAAQDWSDYLVAASSLAYVTTVIATPGPDERDLWIRDKAQGLGVGLGAIASTALMTTALKKTTGRTRPNGESNESFPSGHTSFAAVTTGLARDNLEYLDLGNATHRTLDVGLDALTVGTAWARVEAGAHFPSDTLFAMALGNFFSQFWDAAFLEPDTGRGVALNVTPLDRGVELQWEMRF